jgi:hypothetical protein
VYSTCKWDRVVRTVVQYVLWCHTVGKQRSAPWGRDLLSYQSQRCSLGPCQCQEVYVGKPTQPGKTAEDRSGFILQIFDCLGPSAYKYLRTWFNPESYNLWSNPESYIFPNVVTSNKGKTVQLIRRDIQFNYDRWTSLSALIYFRDSCGIIAYAASCRVKVFYSKGQRRQRNQQPQTLIATSTLKHTYVSMCWWQLEFGVVGSSDVFDPSSRIPWPYRMLKLSI